MCEYVFSICIPTFNRGRELSNLLNSIVNQEDFDNSIEVVICDNNSSDNTIEIVEKFKMYNNIKYYCNKKNIGPDKNIFKVASLASGKYIKYLNDNKVLKQGTISEWKKIFETATESVIFFLLSENIKCIKKTSTIEELLLNITHYSTWLGGISFRKELFCKVCSEHKYSFNTFLIQTELMIDILKVNSSALVVYGEYFYEPIAPIRGGYNYFKVFNEGFILILKRLNNNKLISNKAFRIIKHNLLFNHTFPVITAIVFRTYRQEYKTNNAIIILFKNFGLLLFLYPIWLIAKVFSKFHTNMKLKIEQGR